MRAERVCGKTPILSWMLGFFLTGNKIRKKEGDQEKTRQGRAIGIYHLAPPSSPMLSEPPEDGCQQGLLSCNLAWEFMVFWWPFDI